MGHFIKIAMTGENSSFLREKKFSPEKSKSTRGEIYLSV